MEPCPLCIEDTPPSVLSGKLALPRMPSFIPPELAATSSMPQFPHLKKVGAYSQGHTED